VGAHEARAALTALLARLDPQQRAIAERSPFDGSLRVVAAAGSGKTTTVVAMLARLVWEKVLSPSQIVATTFTSKAAAELRERLVRVLPPGDLDVMRVGTFHGLALRALRRTEAGSARWDMSHCLDVGSGRKAEIPSGSLLWSKICGWAGPDGLPGTGAPGLNLGDDVEPRSFALAIDVARSFGGDDNEAAKRLRQVEEDNERMAGVVDAFDLYTACKQALGAFDFGDALAEYHAGLASGEIHDGAALVVVDEAQDNSTLNLDTARMLAQRGSLYLVGDVRQSIYGWRGAAPEFFQTADRTIKASTLEIPTNYRSARRIVAVGNAVAQGKDWALGDAAKAARTDDGTVTISGAEDPGEEAALVAQEISQSLAGGASADDFAVLCRTNAQAGVFEAALVSSKIPCAVAGGTPFFKRAAVLDVLGYIAIASGMDDFGALGRIVNKPKRMLGKKFVAAVQDYYNASTGLLNALSLAESTVAPRQRAAVREFRSLIGKLRSLPFKPTAEARRGRRGGR